MKPALVVAKKERNALAMKIALAVAKKERNAPAVVVVKTAQQKTLVHVDVKMANAPVKKPDAK